MNSFSSGSFCIVARLIDSLNRRDDSEKQTKISRSFFTKFSEEQDQRLAVLHVMFPHEFYNLDRVIKALARALECGHAASPSDIVEAFATSGKFTPLAHSSISIQDVDDFFAAVGGSTMDEETFVARFLSDCCVDDMAFLCGVLLSPNRPRLRVDAVLAGWSSEMVSLWASSCHSLSQMAGAMLGDEGMSPPCAEDPTIDNEDDDDGYASPTGPERLSFTPEGKKKRDRDDDDKGIEDGHSVKKPTPTTAVSRGRRICKYGAGCYQKNDVHRRDFAHPGDSDYSEAAAPAPAAAVIPSTGPPPPIAPTSSASRAINGIMPHNIMPEDEPVMVTGGHGEYKMKYTAGMYYCTCPVWRFQDRSVNERTCKHLRTYLGDDFDRARVGEDGGGGASGFTAPPSAPKPKAVSAMKPLLLANKANPKQDFSGWWISEKLDGVRAYWDGHTFRSRNGNVFTAPDFLTKGLPTPEEGVTVDGELFGGRNKFQTTVGVVKSSMAHSGWKTLTYEIFDVPSMSAPFEERQAFMEKRFGGKPDECPYLHVVEQIKCTGPAQMQKELERVEALGGEGLMLRRPGSMYEHCRSNTLLKVKTFHDVDAIIRAYDCGKGKNTGLVGALVCELSTGRRFNVGSGLSDAQRRSPPPIGSIIIVKYQNLTDGGVPRFPTFGGVRADGVWPPPPERTAVKGKVGDD